MELWKVSEDCFKKETIIINGNRFLTGNGYMGIRGCLEEFDKQYLPAINLAGIYDQVGKAWREPVNAPNALYTLYSHRRFRIHTPGTGSNGA